MNTSNLIRLAEIYAGHVGRTEATIAKWAGSHARLFDRLREHGGCNVRTYGKVLTWFADNWPADLDWPADIPRPDPRAEVA